MANTKYNTCIVDLRNAQILCSMLHSMFLLWPCCVDSVIRSCDETTMVTSVRTTNDID